MHRSPRIWVVWISLCCCVGSGASETGDPSLYRVVRVEKDDTLNIRKSPDPEAPIQGAVPPDGEGILDLGDRAQLGSYEWYRIRYGKIQGWVNSRYLQRDPALFRVVRVDSDDVLYIRERPNGKAAILGGIPHNGVGIVWQGGKEKHGDHDWLRIRYKKVTGWVNSEYLERQ